MSGASVVECVTLFLTSLRFKVIIRNNLLPQIYTGYLLHLMIAPAAFVEGSVRYGRIIITIDGWMDGWMDGWLSGWLGGWMDGRTDGWKDGLAFGFGAFM